MAVTVSVDEKLLNEAKKISGHKKADNAVAEALEEYVHHRKQLGIADLFGCIEYEPDTANRKKGRG